MSAVVWVMMGIAFWHFAVLVPDRFWGGIVGAFLAAVAGALLSGFLLPSPGIPTTNPPGVGEALWAIPGSIIALIASFRQQHHHGAIQDPLVERTGSLATGRQRLPALLLKGNDISLGHRNLF